MRVVYDFIEEASDDYDSHKPPKERPLWKYKEEIPSKASFMKTVAVYEKQTGNRLPTYSLFVRILKNFSNPPIWIHTRATAVGKAKALYYVDDEVRKDIRKASLR